MPIPKELHDKIERDLAAGYSAQDITEGLAASKNYPDLAQRIQADFGRKYSPEEILAGVRSSPIEEAAPSSEELSQMAGGTMPFPVAVVTPPVIGESSSEVPAATGPIDFAKRAGKNLLQTGRAILAAPGGALRSVTAGPFEQMGILSPEGAESVKREGSYARGGVSPEGKPAGLLPQEEEVVGFQIPGSEVDASPEARAKAIGEIADIATDPLMYVGPISKALKFGGNKILEAANWGKAAKGVKPAVKAGEWAEKAGMPAETTSAPATQSFKEAEDFSRLQPDSLVTLYRGARQPIYGEGGAVDLRLTRWTPDINVAKANAGDSQNIYKVTVPAKSLLPAQELFDIRVARPNDLAKGEALARGYKESAFPEISASLHLPGEPQALLPPGKYNLERVGSAPVSKELTIPNVKGLSYSGVQKVPGMPAKATSAPATQSFKEAYGDAPSRMSSGLSEAESPVLKAIAEPKAGPIAGKVKAYEEILPDAGMANQNPVLKAVEEIPLAQKRTDQVYEAVGGRPVAESKPIADKVSAAVEEIKKVAPSFEKNVTMESGAVRSAAEPVIQDIKLLDMGNNPAKLVSRQVYDHLVNNPGKFDEIAKVTGMTAQELADGMLHHASEAGRNLEIWSSFQRDLALMNPRAADALGKVVPPATVLDKALGLPRRVIETWRGMLVTQLATSVRNAITQGARTAIDIFELPLRKALGEKGLEYDQGLAQFANLFRFKSVANKMEDILNAFPGARKDFFSSYSSDLSKLKTPEGWVVDKINIINRSQEFNFRRTIFYSSIDRKLAAEGKNLSDMLRTGEASKIPVQYIKDAGKTSLEYTFADPKPGLAFVQAVNKIPGGLGHLFITYPRFMMNQLKFLYEYSPLGLLELAGPAGAKAIAGGNAKVFARAIEGTTMLSGAYAIRSGMFGDIAGDKWYEIKSPWGNGKTIDTRPFNPLATYLWAADVIHRSIKGTLNFESLTDGLQAATGMRGGSILWGVEKLKNAARDAMEAKPGSEEYRAAKDYFSGVAGTFVGGFATPLATFRDFLGGFGEFVTKDTATKPFLGPSQSRIPGVESDLPPAYAGTREEPRKIIAPALRQLTGLSVYPAPTAYEKEVDRIGFNRREYVHRTGIPEFDNLISRETGKLADEFINPFVASEEYRQLLEGEKEVYLAKYMTTIRRVGFKAAAAEDTDLYERTLGKVPKHQRKMMEELMQSGEEPQETETEEEE